MSATWPWGCRGCGGPVTRRAIGRGSLSLLRSVPACGLARCDGWITGAELAARQAKRRAARSQEPPCFMPAEQAVLQQAGLAAIAGRLRSGLPAPVSFGADRKRPEVSRLPGWHDAPHRWLRAPG